MKTRILYEPYLGGEPYVFLGFHGDEGPAAARILNGLADRRFRVFYADHTGAVRDAERAAERMAAAELAVFLVSARSQKSLGFRSCVNYALSLHKRICCVYLDDAPLEFGLDMQLINVPGIRLSAYKGVHALLEDLTKMDFFMQDMRGDDAKIPLKQEFRKKTAIAVLASVLALFLASAAVIGVQRVRYENSMAGRIEKMTQTDYLDISEGDASVLGLLNGKTVTTLAARGMGLTDIGALADVRCETLDLGGNPGVYTLEPLLENESLKTVIVTQDMYPAVIRVSGRHSFRIIISQQEEP